MTNLFRELVMIPNMIGVETFSLEVLLIDEEEVKCDNGKRSWRRKGVSIKERRLLKVNDRILLQNKADCLQILPDNLKCGFHKQIISEITQDVSKDCAANYLLSKKRRRYSISWKEWKGIGVSEG